MRHRRRRGYQTSATDGIGTPRREGDAGLARFYGHATPEQAMATPVTTYRAIQTEVTTRYQAFDGTMFDTEAEATAHEETLRAASREREKAERAKQHRIDVEIPARIARARELVQFDENDRHRWYSFERTSAHDLAGLAWQLAADAELLIRELAEERRPIDY